jgi:hypothetical protein
LAAKAGEHVIVNRLLRANASTDVDLSNVYSPPVLAALASKKQRRNA